MKVSVSVRHFLLKRKKKKALRNQIEDLKRQRLEYQRDIEYWAGAPGKYLSYLPKRAPQNIRTEAGGIAGTFAGMRSDAIVEKARIQKTLERKQRQLQSLRWRMRSRKKQKKNK